MKSALKYVLFLFCILIMVYCFYKFFNVKREELKIIEDQEKIIEISEIPEEPTEETNINFEELQSINPEIIAWIYIGGTNINYPILQNKSNTYYLKHNYKKQYSGAGSIYMDASADKNFTSQNTFIYGHYTSNKTMFGELGNFMNQDFFDTHKDIFIYTPTKTYIVDLFSVYVDEANSNSYQMSYANAEELENYLKLIQSKSRIKSDIEDISIEDRIITFYSCSRETNYKKQDRYFLHGIIKEYQYEN